VDLPLDRGPEFNFSCSLLSCVAGSLQLLSLTSCAFCLTLMIGYLRNFKVVCLTPVNIIEEKLGCSLLYNLPSHLQQHDFLCVFMCRKLQAIEIYAPSITTFVFREPPMKMFISYPSLMKQMVMNLCSEGLP
jgi:hypothetical protein